MNHANYRPRLCVHFSNAQCGRRGLTIFGVGGALQAVKEFFSSPHKSPQIRNQEVRAESSQAISQLARSNFDERKFPTPIEEIVLAWFALCVGRHTQRAKLNSLILGTHN